MSTTLKKGNGKTTTLHVHHTFLYIRCTTTTWKCRISCFLEDVSTRQQLSFTFLNFDTYSLLEFNARKICQNLTYWARWNKREQIWRSVKSLFKWRFRSRSVVACVASVSVRFRGKERPRKGIFSLDSTRNETRAKNAPFLRHEFNVANFFT